MSDKTLSATPLNITPYDVIVTAEEATVIQSSLYELAVEKGLFSGTISEFFVGLKGVPGKAANIRLGTVTEGDKAAISVSGTPEDQVWDVVLPAGQRYSSTNW